MSGAPASARPQRLGRWALWLGLAGFAAFWIAYGVQDRVTAGMNRGARIDASAPYLLIMFLVAPAAQIIGFGLSVASLALGERPRTAAIIALLVNLIGFMIVAAFIFFLLLLFGMFV